MATGNGSFIKLEQILESFGPNTNYVWEQLVKYIEHPESVAESWRNLFRDIASDPAIIALLREEVGASALPKAQTASAEPSLSRDKVAPQQEGGRLVPLSGVLARIVENMEQSLSVPTATSLRVIPVKLLDENRQIANKWLTRHGRAKVSYTHIISWAIVKALKKYPNLNSQFVAAGNSFYKDERPFVNLGIAVDVTRKDGTRTLTVPNIKNAGALTFSRFLARYDDLVKKARAGTIDPSDFIGTTVSLTNPGGIGTVSSVARLMSGQGCIIATGAIDYTAQFHGASQQVLSALGIAKTMTITCTYDHRIVQGAESGEFLSAIHNLLLGEEKFYEEIFGELKVPHEPFTWAVDQIPPLAGGGGSDIAEKQVRVSHFINAYRVRGHLIANLDPLVNVERGHPELDPSYHGLTVWDLDREFLMNIGGVMSKSTLRDIIETLRETYCGTIGVEFMFIQHPEQKNWLIRRMEPERNQGAMTVARKKRVLTGLTYAEVFERFLHTKFVGHKRFSLEGGETLIPLLTTVLDNLADAGARRSVIGMAHRGRLNVLTNIIGKPAGQIFYEFEGYFEPGMAQGSGDVKYHLGATGKHVSLNGNAIQVDLAPNPSHLEAVNPVVEGMVRAMQDRLGDTEGDTVVPILIHGDAAFAGQGVVAETLNFSQLEGYKTGGTIHVIINNQIGFTTSPDDARSSPYATDVAKMVQAPIFHVNGDDPEAAVRVAKLALGFRKEFKKDVVIDIFCYRKYGHNEADEPSYTNPLMYRKIRTHPSVREQYAQKLATEKLLAQKEAEKIQNEYRARLEAALEEAKRKEMKDRAALPYQVTREELEAHQPLAVSTGVPMEQLAHIAQRLGTVPEGFAVNEKLKPMLEKRRTFDAERTLIDWSFAEALAFGSLLMEGTPVRLSGQDSERGTFSQRHSVLTDLATEEDYVPLNHLGEGQAQFSVYDSMLSEFAALGFEFGYSVADPKSLVLWEAQFGDFANGAQTIIDQFIASSEAKWQQRCDLVMLLPHGSEGQGPEHSSARLERFLQLCAEDNMYVCNSTTPAQYFHVLRRQMRDVEQRPLVLMTPKSLLRHPLAVSIPIDFTQGRFYEVLDDARSIDPRGVKRVVLCSGKVYYDILHALREKENSAVAVVRLEQFYPFPEELLRKTLAKYENAIELVWAQEEPKNMGGWSFVAPLLSDLLVNRQRLHYVGRQTAASPATGSGKKHQQEQDAIVAEAVGV